MITVHCTSSPHAHAHTHTCIHIYTHTQHTHTQHTRTHTTHSQESTGKHWVSFHFQQSRDELVWVNVVGQASIFLALCLHSAVGELLRQRSNKPIRKPSENVRGWVWWGSERGRREGALLAYSIYMHPPHPQPIRRHPRELPHVTFHHPPTSPLESSEGGGGEEGEGGSVGEVVRSESRASSTSTDRGSVGQEQVKR